MKDKTYFFLFLILLGAFFVRSFRVHELLGFYFDQGRDALVIWRLWHEGKLFLIGPVTGLAGIFLGPLYYYLIAPFYLLGGGSPVIPAVFLAFLSTVAVFMLYFLGWRFHSREAGIFAAAVGAFSYYIVLASRWLSNPTPLLLVSLLLVWAMWNIVRGKSPWWWVVASFLVGISLQLEAASAVFFLPMMLVFAVWQRNKLPDFKTLAAAVGAFFLTLAPQIAFNLRHENILLQGFYRVFLEEKSFRVSFWEVLAQRRSFYWGVFATRILPGWNVFTGAFFLILLGVYASFRRKLFKNPGVPILFLFILTPIVGLIFFQGNYGNIYDYYMTGVYLPFILIFGIGLGELWKRRGGKVAVTFFFFLFFLLNGTLLRNYLRAGVDGSTHISLGNQLQAVNWVLQDAQGETFNVDVYVPPVIPHAYDYLFLWQAEKKCGQSLCGMEKDKQVSLLYTLYEEDPPHPQRLQAWLERQEGIGEVEESVRFGSITVERRTRIR